MEKKPVSIEVIKDSLKKRFNVLFPENIRIVRRFTEYEKDYTEFLYDTFAYSVSCHLPREEYVTCKVILEDRWVVSRG